MADSAPLIDKTLRLSALKRGDRVVIVGLDVSPELAPRLSALGLHAGEWVEVVRRAPFAGPLHLRIGTTDVVMRRDDAEHIIVAR
jgi:ferrous iron transport protein A